MSKVKCIYNGVSEHDMDLLFLLLFSADTEFVRLFLSKASIDADCIEVVSIELSKTDPILGESDITVLLIVDKKKVALLIENKIDAIAMPEQASRYFERGDQGITMKEYDKYCSFIVCPQKYFDDNDEAKKYPYLVTYENVIDFLKTKKNSTYRTYCQQIEQAIDKAKKPPKVVINENANRFFRKYKDYQEENYPELDLVTKRNSNGYWAQYTTRFGAVYLYHKIESGYVDLTFNKAADRIDELTIVSEWLKRHSVLNVSAVQTNKAAALRVIVPHLNMQIPFEDNDIRNIEICFSTIKELIDSANVFGIASGLSSLK